MDATTERWRVLKQFDDWLRAPMLLLSLLWLLILVVELTSGTSDLVATLGTTIWIIFIADLPSASRSHLRSARSSNVTG